VSHGERHPTGLGSPSTGGGATYARPVLGRVDGLTLRAQCLLVGLVALAARLAYWLLATPDRLLTTDAAQYDFLAKNLAAGRGFVDTFPQLTLHATAYRPPGYPALLGLVYEVFWPTPGIGRLLNVVLGTAVAVAVAALIRPRLGPRAAVVGGLAAALSPNLVANDAYVLTEALSLLLIVGLMAAVLDRRWLLAALATGALILTRASGQYLVIVLAVWLFVVVGWRRALGYAAVTALVVAPWLIRNDARLGSPVLVTSNGFNFAALYSPPADEAGHFIDPTKHPYFDDRRLEQFDEVAWDRNLRELAVDNIKDHPAVVAEVVRVNILAYFEIQPSRNELAEQADGRSLALRTATLWTFYLLLGGGVLGLWRRRREALCLLAALIGLYFTAASLLFVAPPRLRAPLELALCIGLAALAAPRTAGASLRREP